MLTRVRCFATITPASCAYRRHCHHPPILHRSLPFSSQPSSLSSSFRSDLYQGQVVLISGGAGFLGSTIAQRFAQHGARTVILSRIQDKATSVAQHINESITTTGSCAGLLCDVTDSQQVESCVNSISRSVGPISILCAAHGVNPEQLALRLNDDDLRLALTTNVSATLYLIRAVTKQMLRRSPSLESQQGRGSSILTLGSVIGSTGNVGQVAYATSKSALIGMTRSLSLELSRMQIRINLLCPGYVAGGGMSEAAIARGAVWQQHLQSKDWLGRAASGTEIADVVLFLSSPAASYITGQVIHVNGGLYLG